MSKEEKKEIRFPNSSKISFGEVKDPYVASEGTELAEAYARFDFPIRVDPSLPDGVLRIERSDGAYVEIRNIGSEKKDD